MAGEAFLVGLDRQRADAAGQALAPVPGLACSTAAGLARRISAGQWAAVETGVAVATARMLRMLPAGRAAALAADVTVDLDTIDRVGAENVVRATWGYAYSWIRPRSRSRRRTAASSAGGGGPVRPAGGAWLSERCGRWVL